MPRSERRTLDVYAPGEGKNHPVVGWIHGGGWRFGDKSRVQLKPKAFTDRGYLFVSINYRFVPQVTVREQAGDVAAAILWVRDNAARYGGDGKRIAVMGHSAGAHLAALACADPRYLKAAGMSLADIRGCAPVDTAMYDAARQIKERGPARSRLYRSVFGEKEADQRALSPITHVKAGPNTPPFLILYVARRPDATAQSKAFAKALTAAGLDAKTFAAEGKTHATINRELGEKDDPPTKAVLEFLALVMKESD